MQQIIDAFFNKELQQYVISYQAQIATEQNSPKNKNKNKKAIPHIFLP